MLHSILIKCDCTAGGERKCSKQGFISLVFQAAVFSLSTAGSRRGRDSARERESRKEERSSMRWGGGSINWGRYGSCYSTEVGLLPDLEAHTYLRDCLPQSTVSSPCTTMLRHSLNSHGPISRQQEAIRLCTCHTRTAKICLRLRLSSHAGHRNVFSWLRGLLKAMLCVCSIILN